MGFVFNKINLSSLKQYLKITFWVFKLSYKFEPYYTVVNLISSFLDRLSLIIDALLIAKITDSIINSLTTKEVNFNEIYLYLGILILYSLFNSIIGYYQRTSNNAIRDSIIYKLKRELYTKISNLNLAIVENPETQNKIDRANNSVHIVASYITQVSRLVAAIINSIISLVIISIYVPYVIPLILLINYFHFLTEKRFAKDFINFIFTNTNKFRLADANSHNLLSTTSLPEIKINNSFKFLDNKFNIFMNWHVSKRVALRNKNLKKINIISFISNLILYTAYIPLINKVLLGSITVGSALFAIRNLGVLDSRLKEFFTHYSSTSQELVRLEDMYELFNLENENEINKAKLNQSAAPEIEFKNVYFKYPNTEKYVLAGLSFILKSGQKIAIIGHNGAGKTTILRLICKFYKINKGEILINGYNIDDISTKSLHNIISMLFQDFNLYSQLTIKENIMIGDSTKKHDINVVKKAAENADALNFIEEYPDKFDQILSPTFDGGIRPSTGQWQKIAIARFFYRNSPLVIFDEPTSSIDAISEYKIFNKIYKFFAKKSVIIVSHRFSTVRNADRILVVEKGKIVEQGSHETLIKHNGYYARSFNLQAKGYSKNKPETRTNIDLSS